MTENPDEFRPVIGLTGGMGSGKSTVLRYLCQHMKATILDADEITREVHGDLDVCESLARAFGPQVIAMTPSGPKVLRRTLAEIAFSSDKKLSELNAIMKPAMLRATRAKIETAPSDKMIVLDAPLLYEAGWEVLTDCVVVLLSPISQRLLRIRQRDDLDDDQIFQRIRAQMEDGERSRRADYLLYNTGDEGVLYWQVDRVFSSINKAAAYWPRPIAAAASAYEGHRPK